MEKGIEYQNGHPTAGKGGGAGRQVDKKGPKEESATEEGGMKAAAANKPRLKNQDRNRVGTNRPSGFELGVAKGAGLRLINGELRPIAPSDSTGLAQREKKRGDYEGSGQISQGKSGGWNCWFPVQRT